MGQGSEPELGKPEPPFELTAGRTPGPDGETLLIVDKVTMPEEEKRRSGIKIVQNWFSELRR